MNDITFGNAAIGPAITGLTPVEQLTMSTPSDATEIYCLKCRAKTPSRDVERVTMKNGRPALRAVCAECGTGKYRIGASD